MALLALAAPLCAAATLTAGSGDRLRAGRFLWDDDGAEGPVGIVISRSQQRAYVYRGGELIGITTISTGKRGHRTPVGTFTILQKQVHHRSNQYSNAPMPFMQRLTWGGVALHAGRLPGYPASHGCIRMPWAFARKLFAATSLGAVVLVTDGGPELPPLQMASAAPVPPRAVPVAPAASPVPRVELASAAIDRPPAASWREKSADDYVTWGSVLPGRSAPAAP